jgi:hypothetical protein
LSPMDIALLGGGAAEPLYWPFETNPQTLELECGRERIVIEVSTAKARVSLSDSTGELHRDFGARTKFRYSRMTEDEYEDELVGTEESRLGGVISDWLVIQGGEVVELYFDDMSHTCQAEKSE